MTNLEIAKDQLELALNEIKNTLTVEQGELIHDYVSEALKQVKNCSIPVVVNRRELLLAFRDKLNESRIKERVYKDEVDDFLDSQ